MNILDFGACIENGNYRLHSKFKNVHNYTNDSEIISLVSAGIGKGPNNIVLDIFPQQVEQALVISNQTLSIGNTILHTNQVEPRLNEDIYINDVINLLYVIKMLSVMISDKISPQSLGFLLFPKNEIHFQTSFEKAFISHVKQTVQNITLEKLPTITKNMKGVGFGLTPSGDDFNCGVLYALNYFNEIVSRNLSQIIDVCYSNSIGKNLITNTFLKYAYLNHFYENFYELLKALKNNDNFKISISSKKIINTGHTSGSDMLTGFILTIKGVLYDKKPS